MEERVATRAALFHSFDIAVEDTVAYVEERTGLRITNSDKIDVEKLLYRNDGKTIDERLEEIYQMYAINQDLGFLWRRLEDIMTTELAHIENYLVRKICGKIGYRVVYRVERSQGSCAGCTSYSGLTFDPGIAPDVPLHPKCGCTLDINTEELEDRQTLDDLIMNLEEIDW